MAIEDVIRLGVAIQALESAVSARQRGRHSTYHKKLSHARALLNMLIDGKTPRVEIEIGGDGEVEITSKPDDVEIYIRNYYIDDESNYAEADLKRDQDGSPYTERTL